MNVEILNSNHTTTESDVLNFEKILKVSLPDDYRNFLLHYNGGHPKPHGFIYKLPDGRDWSGGVRDFFGLGVDSWEDLRHYYALYEDRVPKQMLPIANDDGGNLLLLALKDVEKGKIYFWDHNEESEDDELPSYENIYFVANNFTEFLKNLKEE